MVCTAWSPDLDAGLTPKETGVYTFRSLEKRSLTTSQLTLSKALGDDTGGDQEEIQKFVGFVDMDVTLIGLSANIGVSFSSDVIISW
jgi:hypothetical protein